MLCPKCKNPIDPTSSACEWCGYNLSQNAENKPINTSRPVQQTKPKSVLWWYKECWKHYIDFSGRARRMEYWSFALGHFMIILLISIAGGILFTKSELFSALLLIYFFLALLPSFSVLVRRLHDTGRSGLKLLLILIPVIGALAILIFILQDTDPATNKWGANPKLDS